MEGQLWLSLYGLARELGKGHDRRRKTFGDWAIVATLLWSAVHDRPVCWACDERNWPGPYRLFLLPSQSTMSKRSRTVGVLSLLAQMQSALRDEFPRSLLKFVDAKPLPVGGASKDRDARCGRAARGTARGYKIHVVWDAAARVPDDWRLAPMSANEKAIAPALFAAMGAPAAAGGGGGFCYAGCDNQYDGNSMFDAAAAAGGRLAVNPRAKAKAGEQKGTGHRKQSPHRLRGLATALAENPLAACGLPPPTLGPEILAGRGAIERGLGLWGNFAGGLGPLPNWVRKPRRVALWVQCKVLILLQRECRRRRAELAEWRKNCRANEAKLKDLAQP